MSDPLPTAPAAGPMTEADREARIEQLLLSGLDQYFAGRYERAINIWTRVAFLERGHGRARAYIERARGALAERQREADELAHAGVEAYHAGELQTARDLLTRATDAGASDTAMLFMERLRRVDASSEPPPPSSADPETPAAVRTDKPQPMRVVATMAAILGMALAIFLGSMRVASWLSERPLDVPAAAAVPPEPLPVVHTSELRIAEARQLAAAGRLNDALRTLGVIDIADPKRPEADSLRAEIQRTLLGMESR